MDDFALGRTQAKPHIPEKAKVYMFKDPLYELDEATLQERAREALVHETGHVLFERLASDMQRFEWGRMFNQALSRGEEPVSTYAKKSLREDFAECFMFYRLGRDKLYKEYRARYDFIDKLYKEIPK